MLSTLRVASRSAAAREANMRTVIIGARQASAWSKVPQGPPVSLTDFSLLFLALFQSCDWVLRTMLMQWT
jgi:aspartate aminotransferase